MAKIPSDKELLEKRISLLKEYHQALERWFNGSYSGEERSALKSLLNHDLVAVRRAVLEAGTLKHVTIGPPPAIGGLVVPNADPFENLFESFWGMSLIPAALDSIEQAIGVYEHIIEGTGLIRPNEQEAIDIEAAIERSLRPSFRRQTPSLERDVQDALEVILNALGFKFKREKESTAVGGKSFKPDFTLEDIDLALEVKLARQGHGAAEIQEEIAADIAAYRTKWKRILFVIYDLGVMDDPYRFRVENMKAFGVNVIIVKH